MNINSTGRLTSVLDYLDDDKNDNSIESILTSAGNYRTASIRQKLGILEDASDTDRSKTILTASRSAAGTLDKMLSEAEDSIFKKAENDKSDTALSASVTEIQAFISSYNTLVKNMNSQGGKINIVYLTELGKAYVDNEKELNAIGITRGKDGLLTVDTDKLKAADLDALKAAFHGQDSYAAKVNDTITDIQKVTSKTSAMNGLQSSNYGNDASESDLTSMFLDHIFNSKA